MLKAFDSNILELTLYFIYQKILILQHIFIFKRKQVIIILCSDYESSNY